MSILLLGQNTELQRQVKYILIKRGFVVMYAFKIQYKVFKLTKHIPPKQTVTGSLNLTPKSISSILPV